MEKKVPKESSLDGSTEDKNGNEKNRSQRTQAEIRPGSAEAMVSWLFRVTEKKRGEKARVEITLARREFAILKRIESFLLYWAQPTPVSRG